MSDLVKWLFGSKESTKKHKRKHVESNTSDVKNDEPKVEDIVETKPPEPPAEPEPDLPPLKTKVKTEADILAFRKKRARVAKQWRAQQRTKNSYITEDGTKYNCQQLSDTLNDVLELVEPTIVKFYNHNMLSKTEVKSIQHATKNNIERVEVYAKIIHNHTIRDSFDSDESDASTSST
jgi:hypothetical protein